MKLTADLVSNSPAFINAIKEYELDLSGNHISLIENLGATRDLHDSLNLSNNTIRILGNFPELSRLHSIYIADNRVASIEQSLSASLPNLRTLVLTDNDMAELVDLEPLRELHCLEHLSLVNNPVMFRAHARLWCVWRLAASLRVLNFERVTTKEREEARALFETTDGEMSALAKDILAIEASANTFVPGEGLADNTGETDLDKQQSIAELKARIREEMAQIEAMDEYI
ncbi:U2 snRNP complex subunit [Coemansia sp. RSA 2618]|nr:U2 snRNP complex subunit [Coemansia sp. RSA 2618]